MQFLDEYQPGSLALLVKKSNFMEAKVAIIVFSKSIL